MFSHNFAPLITNLKIPIANNKPISDLEGAILFDVFLFVFYITSLASIDAYFDYIIFYVLVMYMLTLDICYALWVQLKFVLYKCCGYQ